MAYNQRNSQRDNDRVRYELKERIGVLGIKDNGWTKEVNVVSWNGGIPKIDIREWDPTHERMAKGITMLEDEAENLAKALAGRYGIGKLQANSRYSQHQSTVSDNYSSADSAQNYESTGGAYGTSGDDHAAEGSHENDFAASTASEETDGAASEQWSGEE